MARGQRVALAASALLLAAPVTAHADAIPSATAHARFDAAAVKRRLGPQAVVDVAPGTGTPRVLAKLDGALSGPAAGSPTAIAAAYVRSHMSDLGLTAADVDALDPASTTTADGVTQVRWGQSYRGIPAAGSDLRVTVARDGRVTAVLGSPAHALSVPSIAPAVDAGAAMRAVQSAVGVYRSLPTEKGPAGATRTTTFRGGDTATLQIAEGGKLAWRVVYDAAPDAIYDATVDAQTGKVLRRVNLVKSVTNAKVWDRWAGTQRTVDIGPWLSSTTRLDGPFVHAFADVNDSDTAQASEEVAPGSYTFNPVNSGTGCSVSVPCAWTGSGASWQTNESQDAVQAFYYANKFREHLAADPIDFMLGDKLDLNTDDGAFTGPDKDHLNNANMYTPARGSTPRMQMYLFKTTATSGLRNVNGGDDAAIVYHEYTHGLSNRLVVDATGTGALNEAESGAMGEAWSDWYAMDYLVQQGLQADTAADGELDMGAGTDLDAHVLRTEPIDCSVGSIAAACGRGGYTYANFGHVIGYPEVHGDGEIWAQTLWDIRKALGPAEAERLVTQGMRVSPPEPSFLDERNAILTANQTLHPDGTNRSTLWSIFANRGMGYHAVANDGADVSPIAKFDLPPDPNGPKGTISGTVTSADTGAPLAGATVGVAGLESGADKLVATTDGSGGYTLANVPYGTYPRLLATSTGYWPGTSAVTVGAGNANPTVNLTIPRNWASSDGGATVSSAQDDYADYGCGPDKLIDQALGTGWSMNNPGGASQPALIRLPAAVDIDTFGMDPNGTCGDTTASMTTRALVETTTDPSCGSGWITSADVTFGSEQAGRLNPIHPNAGTAGGVRCVRLTLLTGGNGFRDFSELAVFSKPASQPSPTPTATASPTPVATVSPTPTPVATPTPLAAPSFTLPKSGKNGAAVFSVRCAAACGVTASLTADARTKRSLRLSTLGTKRVSVTRAGTSRIAIALSPKAQRAMRRRKLKSVTVTLKVTASYAGVTPVGRSARVKISVSPRT